MKFSWKLTNHFLKINEESFEDIKNQLILSGIEIEKINEFKNDKILDLSLTTNRREINSALSLAREISTVTEKIIQINPIKFNLNKEAIKKLINLDYLELEYCRGHIIEENINNKIPTWISSQLEIQGKYHQNKLENIQEYIKIKWGETFKIIRIKNLKEIIIEDDVKNYQNLITPLIKKYNNQSSQKELTLILFITKQNIQNKNIDYYDISEFYENYYLESINIIKELNRSTIGKYHEMYRKLIPNKNKVILEKKTLNNWLGYTNKEKTKFLKTEQTIKILQKLKLFPKYVREKKLFITQIPPYRKHDLIKDIDIIEEIGRIHEFKNFYNSYKDNINKGKKSQSLIRINKIRNILRDLGLSEVINCSLTNNEKNINYQVKIYNPITEEQKYLRINIVDSLIKNYKYHIKYSNKSLLIFEIGKTFIKTNKGNKYLEEKSLGGLIYSNEYNRHQWIEKSRPINLFHVKGIIELFVEKINAKITLKEIPVDNVKHHINDMLKESNRIGIYDQKTQQIVGILGELNQKYITGSQNKSHKIYLFEIQLNKLIKSISQKKHLNYSKKIYSDYPSITRDISIPIKKQIYITKIQEKIQNINKEFTESIEIFNEYTKTNRDNLKEQRFVGIRIKYRSLTKTLKTEDIKKIDDNLDNLIKMLN